MSRRVIWITGPAGSGKTTAARLAATAMGRRFEAVGALFRARAEAAGLSLAEFSRYAEAHPEVDRSLDEELMARARPGDLLEGRVVGALLRRHGTPVLAVQVTASEEVRAERVARRDNVPREAALRDIRLRAASERQRYLAWYRIDLDIEPFDAVLDATVPPAETVAASLVDVVRRAEAAA